MNHYYATGAPIFEGPPRKHSSPTYGSVGHLENYLHKYQIEVKYTCRHGNSALVDLHLTAPNGKILFVDSKKLDDKLRKKIYKWIKKNGKE